MKAARPSGAGAKLLLRKLETTGGNPSEGAGGRRRSNIAAARNKLTIVAAAEEPEGTRGARENPGADKRAGFLKDLIRDVLDIESSIPDPLPSQEPPLVKTRARKKGKRLRTVASHAGASDTGPAPASRQADNARLKIGALRPARRKQAGGPATACHSPVEAGVARRSASATYASESGPPKRHKPDPADAADRRSGAAAAPLLSAPDEQAEMAPPLKGRRTRRGLWKKPRAKTGRRRKPVNPRLKKTLIAVALLLVLAGLLWTFTCTGLLDIKHIEIRGNEKLDTDYLRGLSGISEGTNLLKLNVKAVENALLSEPYVASARISRRFPNTVAISISERKPEATIAQNGKYHLVDEQGMVLETVDDKPPGLPEIQGLQPPLLYPGQQIEDPSFAAFGQLISSMPPDLRNMTMAMGNRQDGGLFLQARVNRIQTRVIFGEPSDLEKKSEVALLALKDLASRYPAVDYIDVTFPDHPVIKPIN
jgi:cell division protein FtsQ